MFSVDLELRAVAWETKPQKKKISLLYAASNLQMTGCACVLKGNPLNRKAPEDRVYDPPKPPQHSMDTVTLLIR